MPDETSGRSPARNTQEASPSQPIPSPVEQREVGEHGNGNANGNQPDAKSFAKEIHWVHAATLGTQVVLGVVGIFALIIYHGQLTVMSGQLEQMKSATAQAKVDNVAAITAQQKIAQDSLVGSQQSVDRSLGATIDNFHLDQRAWVGMVGVSLDTVEIDKPVYAHVVFFNSGKTVAKHVTAILAMNFFPTELKKLPPANAGESKSVGVLVPGARYDTKFTDRKRKVNKVDKDRITGDWYTYVWGEVKYIDIFKQPHHTLFCGYRQGVEGDLMQCRLTMTPAERHASTSPVTAAMIIHMTHMCARKAGWTAKQIAAFDKEAMSGDYSHLLAVVQNYFNVS